MEHLMMNSVISCGRRTFYFHLAMGTAKNWPLNSPSSALYTCCCEHHQQAQSKWGSGPRALLYHREMLPQRGDWPTSEHRSLCGAHRWWYHRAAAAPPWCGMVPLGYSNERSRKKWLEPEGVHIPRIRLFLAYVNGKQRAMALRISLALVSLEVIRQGKS